MRTLSLTALFLIAFCLQGCGGSDAPPADESSNESGSEATETESSLGTPSEMPENIESGSQESSEETTSAAPAGDSTLNYITEDAVAAIVVRPSKALNNPLVKEIIALADEANPSQKLSEQLAQAKTEMGVEINQIDHILIVADQNLLNVAPMMMMGMPAPAKPIVAVQLVDGVDSQLVMDSAPSSAERIKIAGGDGVKTPDGGVVYKVSSSRLLYGDEAKLESILNNKHSASIRNLLEKSLSSDLGVAVNLEPVKQSMQQGAQGNPMMAMVIPIVQQMQTMTIAADLEAENLLNISVDTPNTEAAKAVQQSLQGFLQMGKQQYEQAKGDVPEEMKEMMQAFVDGANLSSNAEVVSLAIPRPANFEKLPEMLKPALNQAATAAKMSQNKNNLKQIGLAFHNYHAVYNHFPAIDSNGGAEGEQKGKGLSWRVHLLPFIEEAPLYEQFNMDEPWDSEHNKALIEQMPMVFGDNPEGKTSIHVFQGEKVAFKEGHTGPRIRDYLDGTSNTILVVEAGDDTADIWTKPGGLEFNADDPIAALGNIGEMFHALLCDGSVRNISKSIDKETLSNLIQNQDGNPIQDF